MDSPYPQHTLETAPPAALPFLEEVQAGFGMIPNLERTLASAPPALEGYVRLWELFDRTTLSPVERQVVYQTANRLNGCTYCVPWHTLLSRKAGMSEPDVEALRRGEPLGDPRLEALRLFTAALIEHRGRPPHAITGAFHAAGYTHAQALEVILGLATKLISNYSNAIAATPLDAAVRHLAWDPAPAPSSP